MDYTEKDFTEAVYDLMRERYATGPFDRPTISTLAHELGRRWHYENVRKILAGDRNLTPAFMEDVARLFGIEPTYFREYRISQMCNALRDHPSLIGEAYGLYLALEERMKEKDENGDDLPRRP